jgi:hypothetical protein
MNTHPLVRACCFNVVSSAGCLTLGQLTQRPLVLYWRGDTLYHGALLVVKLDPKHLVRVSLF